MVYNLFVNTTDARPKRLKILVYSTPNMKLNIRRVRVSEF